MFNNLKAVTHKQSKYFTIMLIPDSSSKTRSIKIPLLAFYIVLTIIILIISTIAISVMVTNYFKDKAYKTALSLEQSVEQNNKLLEKSKELSTELENEKENAERAVKMQNATFEERISIFEERINYYEDKAEELQQKIDDLNKAKEDIYNQLSQRDYLPKIEQVAYYEPAGKMVFLSIDADSASSSLNNLDVIYTELDNEVMSQMVTYNHLLNEMERIKPYLLNYPTIWPVRGRITSEFASRANPFGGGGSEFHNGLDISVPIGTDVKVTGGGIVEFSGVQSGYGNFVIVNHGYGIKTCYGHNSKLLVSVGQRVERGDIIAKSGNTGRSTGPHVHYEVRVNGAQTNPRKFLD